jgi:hypothetical protein
MSVQVETIPQPWKTFWFLSYSEANDWLDFECSERDAEAAAWQTPDHYAEWANWRNRWEANGYPEF